MLAPKPSRLTVPPRRAAKLPIVFFPTLAAMLPGPPLAPKVRLSIVTFVLPFPFLALKVPVACTVPAPSTGSTTPLVIWSVRLEGFSFRPCEPRSSRRTLPPFS
jgi:hypothetical protein